MAEAFERFSPVSLSQALAEDSFEEMLVEHIEPRLGRGRPLFLCEYPAQLASLARLKPGEPAVAERFELYISGLELANGFSELTDPCEQRRRFQQELQTIEKREGRRQAMPEQLLDELAAIESAAGIAFGLDRLLMLAMGKSDISEVMSFTAGDFR